MKGVFTTAARIAALLTVLLMCTPSHGNDKKTYEAKLKQLQKTTQALQSSINEVKSERDKLQNTLRKAEVSIGQLSRAIKNTQTSIDEQEVSLNQLEQQRAQLQKDKASQIEAIGKALNQAYKMGNQSHLRLLLNQAEPTRISRLMKYHQYFVEARQSKITQFLATLSSLAEIESAIIASRDKLTAKATELESQRQSLGASQTQKKQVLASLNRDIETKDQTLRRLAGDKKRLQTLIDQATQSLAKLTLPDNTAPFTKMRGTFSLPTKGRILHRFGGQRAGGGKVLWNGIFIASPANTRINAVHYGRVIFADYLKGYGLLIIVDHGEGYMSLYAHNKSLLKETGDWVTASESIATVGNTGGIEQAGLYFEIRHKGRPQNPSTWLKRS